MPAYSFSYCIPYLLLLFILLFLYANEIGTLKIFSSLKSRKIAFVCLLLFLGLRGHLFTDYISYYPFYENLPSAYNLTLSTFIDNFFEPGFILYSSLIKTIFPNYFIWIFINTLLDLWVFYWLFKKYSASIVLSFIVFIAFQGLSIEINLYRNSKAIIMFMLSLPYLQQRRFFSYLMLNLVGLTFHSSAIFYIPLYFVLNKRIPKFLVWGLFLIVNVFFLFDIHFTSMFTEYLSLWGQLDNLSMKLGRYQGMDESYGFSLGYLERLISFLIFTFSYNKLVKQNEINRIFYNCYFLYYITFLFFADVNVLTERIPLLFIFSYWVLYPNVLLVQKRRIRLGLYLILWFLVLSKAASNNNIFSRYDNLLWGIESYETRYSIFRYYNDII